MSVSSDPILALTQQYVEGVNAQAVKTYQTQYDGWVSVCMARGQIQPDKPLPALAQHVSPQGFVVVGPDRVCPELPDPTFHLTPPAGFNTTQTDPYIGHLIAIEQMLLAIKAKLGA